ncbi:hypothetical protein hrd7_25470 [Leptolinea sp. HRD-7]|nr:hypothetical protein hrd7_25470 [Leptolinea sp. HRD-7]
MTHKLSVPYVGQVGDGANGHGNDCGPASAAMVITFAGAVCPTVDKLFDEVQPAGDAYTSFGDLSKLLDARGIDVDYDQGVSNGKLYEYLTRGMPLIALIRYGALARIRPNLFTGSHFVVVIGIDLDTVYINDPLNTPTSGEGIAVPLEMWEDAWGTLADGNPQRSLLIPSMQAAASTVRVVYPRDKNGCNVRSVPGDATEKTKLYAVPFDPMYTKSTSRMQVYEVKVLDRSFDRNWGRIHPSQQWWVCLDYTVTK